MPNTDDELIRELIKSLEDVLPMAKKWARWGSKSGPVESARENQLITMARVTKNKAIKSLENENVRNNDADQV